MKYKCPKCGKEYAVQVVCCCDPDAAVVERFNELVKEGKICGSVDNKRYTLRPTPRYRPFTAVEAAGQLGKQISFCDGRVGLIEWHISSAGVSLPNDGFFTWEEMLEIAKFSETNEPFGVKL